MVGTDLAKAALAQGFRILYLIPILEYVAAPAGGNGNQPPTKQKQNKSKTKAKQHKGTVRRTSL
jgi:hypothetical protein